MSEERSHSQVRNLRAVFESNAAAAAPTTESNSPPRGRSNGHLSPASNLGRPLSKVRSSFISVESGIPTMEIDPEQTKSEYAARQESSAGLRRQSFSMDETRDSNLISHMRDTIHNEEERRGSIPLVETIPEAAIEATPAATPAVEAKDYLAAGQVTTNEKLPQSKLRDVDNANPNGEDDDDEEKKKNKKKAQPGESGESKAMALPDDDMPADNPDKPVTGVQGEPGPMQPSDLTDRSAVSPSPEPEAPSSKAKEAKVPEPTITAPAKQAPRARRGTVAEADAVPAVALPHRPSVAANADTKSTLSPARPKTPTSTKKATPAAAKPSPSVKPSSTLTPKPVVKKASRTSLNQSASKSPQAKPAPSRSPSRPVKVSPHITAPTAASAAKHEPQATKAAAPTASAAAKHEPQATKAAAPTASAAKHDSQAPKAAAPTASAPKAAAPKARAPAAAKPAVRPSATTSSTAGPKKSENKAAASTKGPDEGFLARMMRPTASSANKVHDKTDAKSSPPVRAPSVVKKGSMRIKSKVEKVANGVKSSGDESAKAKSQDASEGGEADAGTSTPVAGQESANGGLEATPAFESTTIR